MINIQVLFLPIVVYAQHLKVKHMKRSYIKCGSEYVITFHLYYIVLLLWMQLAISSVPQVTK